MRTGIASSSKRPSAALGRSRLGRNLRLDRHGRKKINLEAGP